MAKSKKQQTKPKSRADSAFALFIRSAGYYFRLHLEKTGAELPAGIEQWTRQGIDVQMWDDMAVNDTDRGCLLSVVSFVDDMLEFAIRFKLEQLSDASKSDIDTLLTKGQVPPLRSFAMRIFAARVPGIINNGTKKILLSMRDLRNTGAHAWRMFTFTDENVEKIWEAVCMEHGKELLEAGLEEARKYARDHNEVYLPTGPRLHFICAVSAVLVDIADGAVGGVGTFLGYISAQKTEGPKQ